MFNMQQLPVKSISISYCALWKLNNFILYFIRLQNSLACKDEDLKLVGSKSENKGRLEVCLIKGGALSMEMDGHILTLK